jgi:hypothetical protein
MLLPSRYGEGPPADGDPARGGATGESATAGTRADDAEDPPASAMALPGGRPSNSTLPPTTATAAPPTPERGIRGGNGDATAVVVVAAPASGRDDGGTQRASKTLSSVRQSFENILKSNNVADFPHRCDTQLLTTQRQQDGDGGRKDFDTRVSFDGNIVLMLDAVMSAADASSASVLPSNGGVAAGSEDVTMLASVVPYPASSHAMNGDYLPTMAPPMFPDRPRRWDFLESKPRRSNDDEKKKDKTNEKSKKRKRDKISKKKDATDEEEITDEKRRGRGKKIGKMIAATTEEGGVVTDEISEPKRSKLRSRKSDGGGGAQGATTTSASNSTKGVNGAGGSFVGGEDRSKNTTTTRVLPDFGPRPRRYEISTDDDPNRVCNPLLSLPQFPAGIAPPIEDVPQGGELWNMSDLHFHDPDTYPVGYLARVLGFDVPEEEEEEDGCREDPPGRKFDPASAGRSEDRGERDAMAIPKRGSFCDRVWKGGLGGARANVVGGSAAASPNYDDGMHDDLKLTYSDPLYVNILSSYRGYNDDDFKDAGKGFVDELSALCLDYAKERGVLPGKKSDGVSFRFGDEKDEQALTSLAEKVR